MTKSKPPESLESEAAPPTAPPSSVSRRRERVVLRSESAASQRPRKRQQLCKRCAALVRKRTKAFRSRCREIHLRDQRFVAWIVAQAFQQRFNQESQHSSVVIIQSDL